jgi:hypothetical protein
MSIRMLVVAMQGAGDASRWVLEMCWSCLSCHTVRCCGMAVGCSQGVGGECGLGHFVGSLGGAGHAKNAGNRVYWCPTVAQPVQYLDGAG